MKKRRTCRPWPKKETQIRALAGPKRGHKPAREKKRGKEKKTIFAGSQEKALPFYALPQEKWSCNGESRKVFGADRTRVLRSGKETYCLVLGDEIRTPGEKEGKKSRDARAGSVSKKPSGETRSGRPCTKSTHYCNSVGGKGKGKNGRVQKGKKGGAPGLVVVDV